ncbi:MAG: hypothetical protein OHK0029_11630 [Armatimonadaceae bacterium]
MAQLSQSKADLEAAGAAIFAISNEEASDLKKMQERHQLENVTFLSDRDGQAAKLYSGTYPNETMSQPGTFVINKNKKVTYAYLNEDFRTRAPTDAVVMAVKAAAQETDSL